MNQSTNLAPQIDLSPLTKSKSPHVLVKAILAQLQTDLCRPDVGRFRDDIFDRQNTVSLMVAQECFVEVELPVLAIECVCQSHQPFVERSRHDHDLKGRSRLNHISDNAIPHP